MEGWESSGKFALVVRKRKSRVSMGFVVDAEQSRAWVLTFLCRDWHCKVSNFTDAAGWAAGPCSPKEPHSEECHLHHCSCFDDGVSTNRNGTFDTILVL
jgi:hypothetical protein